MKTYKHLIEKITVAQQRALKWYSVDGSADANHTLHQSFRGKLKKDDLGWSWGGKKTLASISRLDDAFADKSNHGTNVEHVYSGVPESPERIFSMDKEKNPNHDPSHVHVHLPAYTSTSKKAGIARDFAGMEDGYYHMLKIKVDPDHPHIDMNKHKASYNSHEQEVLLHRGTRLKIHANPEIKHEKYGMKTKLWNAEIVGHHLDEHPQLDDFKKKMLDPAKLKNTEKHLLDV